MGLLATQVLAQEPNSIVYDFSAVWCGPCQQMAPLVARLEREGLPVRKVDIDKESALADKFGVSTIPTFVLVVDGKEVERHSGAMTETQLRQLIAKVPATSQPLIARTNGLNRGELGAARSFQETLATVADSTSDTTSQESALGRLLPFRNRRENQDQLTIRGNDSETGESPTPTLSTDPMESSVRIRVTINGKINLGSGTIIHSEQGLTKILTCAHIFRGINEDSKIEVDLLSHHKDTVLLARLDSINEEADLGVITVATPKPVPVAAIAQADHTPHVGEQVIGIGCSGGDPPTREQIRVTAVDKYVGPHNLECTGLPVRGRSGGGLFNAQGEVVGVCVAADTEGNRGFYSGLFAVHSILEENQLAFLFRSEQPEPEEALATVAPPHPSAAVSTIPSTTPPEFMPQAAQPVPQAAPLAAGNSTPAAPSTARQPVDLNPGQAEVVVIIRDPSQPDGQSRIVLIHNASDKFLSYLNGELDATHPSHTPLSTIKHSQHTSVARRQPTTAENSSHRITHSAQPIKSTGQLQHTSLSQPVVPQRYVRSSRHSATR